MDDILIMYADQLEKMVKVLVAGEKGRGWYAANACMHTMLHVISTAQVQKSWHVHVNIHITKPSSCDSSQI